MKRSGYSVLAFMLAFVNCASAEEPNVFSNSTAGIRMTKPADWHYVTAAQNLDNIKALKLSDAEIYRGALSGND